MYKFFFGRCCCVPQALQDPGLYGILNAGTCDHGYQHKPEPRTCVGGGSKAVAALTCGAIKPQLVRRKLRMNNMADSGIDVMLHSTHLRPYRGEFSCYVSIMMSPDCLTVTCAVAGRSWIRSVAVSEVMKDSSKAAQQVTNRCHPKGSFSRGAFPP